MNDDEYEEEDGSEDGSGHKRLTVGRVIKYTLKYLGIAVIVLVYALVILRMATSATPKAMTTYIWTDAAKAAYASGLTVYTEKSPDYIDSDGYFAVSDPYADLTTGEFQVTVRYNNSTVRKVAEKNSVDKIEGEPFVYMLSDGAGNVYTAYVYASGSRNVYNYRQLVFSGVDFSALTASSETSAADQTAAETTAPETTAAAESGETTTAAADTAAFSLTLKCYYAGKVVQSDPLVSLEVFSSGVSYGSAKLGSPDTAETKTLHTPPEYLLESAD